MIMLQAYLYEVIREEIEKCRQAHKAPVVASERAVFSRIHADLLDTIAEMEADGLITHHENINGIRMFRQVEDETDNVQR